MPHLKAAKDRTTGPEEHHDGLGTCLRLAESGSKSCDWRITVDGPRRDVGLNGQPKTGLTAVHSNTVGHLQAISVDGNPFPQKYLTAIPIFREAARTAHNASHPRRGIERHVTSYSMSLESRAFQEIGYVGIDLFAQSQVTCVLTHIWGTRIAVAKWNGRDNRDETLGLKHNAQFQLAGRAAYPETLTPMGFSLHKPRNQELQHSRIRRFASCDRRPRSVEFSRPLRRLAQIKQFAVSCNLDKCDGALLEAAIGTYGECT